MWKTQSLTQVLTPTAIALGNFDGLHRGHQQVIRSILDISDSVATVVTFDPHPHTFFTGRQRPLLTPRTEKVHQLEALGLEQLVLLPFDKNLAQLSAERFVQEILLEQLQATYIAVGANFHFGQGRRGNAQMLQTIAQAAGVQVAIAPIEQTDSERISSSGIRQALDQGEITKVNLFLGRSYQLQGTVVQGQQLGRTIGFPTANLQVSADKYLPRSGVYQVRVQSPQSPGLFPKSGQLGVMNIGMRPTVNNTSQTTIEIHLLNWSGDLYGQALSVSLEQFLRPEQKFDSLGALKAQIQRDCEIAQTVALV
ncbi:MAG: bifunctional riboflavin kinase/FAD synthetase [Spirulina sp. SIO3F2]|nr:bifunctional riboflavin kinase/FAD synthetase [Spirulina sp. SIO3F2]